MHGTVLRITTAVLGLAALAATTAGGALADGKKDGKKDGYGYDSQVCYKVDYSNDRLVLDVKPHSPLYFHGGYPQIVWDAEGKYVTSYGGYPDMAVADGAVVTTKSNGYSGSYYKGAHLGVDVPGSSYAFDCTSSYESPTPDVWSCKNGKKLYKTNDDYCGFFKDSGYTGKDTGSK
jgi:uncharacterized protein with WD repeat